MGEVDGTGLAMLAAEVPPAQRTHNYMGSSSERLNRQPRMAAFTIRRIWW